jgi:hypothetical protein
LTKDEYSYLLPVHSVNLSVSNDNYYFNGDSDALADMLSRLKGLYNCFDDYDAPVVNYECFSAGSLKPFRDKMALMKTNQT